jgi:4-amino-4-deoxy-L-arabinose transferase-like glycosyltransferase
VHFLKLITYLHPKYLPFLAIAISIVVLLAFWKIVPGGSFNQKDNPDYTTYYLPVAQNIAHGQGITIHGKPVLEYPPGYPVIAAGCLLIANQTGCNENLILRLCIVLFFSFGALLIYLLAKKIWNPFSALLASILWSCYPIVLWSARNPNTELPFSVFLYTGMLCVLSGWRTQKRSPLFFFIGGVLCGISMLIRPIAIGIGILFALLLLLQRSCLFRRKLLFALCLVAGNLLTVLPWELWVYSQTHHIVLLSSSNRNSVTVFDGLTFGVWNPEGIRKGITVPRDVRNLMNEVVQKYMHDIESTSPKEMYAFMADKFKKQPVTVIKFIAIKAVRCWYGTFTNKLETPIFLVQLMYLLFLLWASVILWRKHQELRFLLIAGFVITCYFWGMSILVDPLVRYMMPVFGSLIIIFPAIPLYFFDCRQAKKNMVKTTTITTE